MDNFEDYDPLKNYGEPNNSEIDPEFTKLAISFEYFSRNLEEVYLRLSKDTRAGKKMNPADINDIAEGIDELVKYGKKIINHAKSSDTHMNIELFEYTIDIIKTDANKVLEMYRKGH